MASGIPHSTILRQRLAEFLADTTEEVSRVCEKMAKEPDFSGIFRNSSAAVAVLSKWARRNPVTLIATAASIARRAPLLIAAGQHHLALIELRRFVECISRYPYFFDHRVEWAFVQSSPATAITRDDTDPIAWCATREQRWYVDYINARFRTDRSGLIKTATAHLSAAYREMSAYVHTAVEAADGHSVKVAIRAPLVAELSMFREVQRRSYSAGVLVALAPRPSTIGRLAAMERAWFDWLVGDSAAKAVTGGSFLAA